MQPGTKLEKLFGAMDNGKTTLGVGPMSWNFINMVIEFANKHSIPISLVSSRGQVECESMGGGYVTTTEKLGSHIKKYDLGGYVTLSRDHGSLWKGKGEEKLEYSDAYDRAMESLTVDIQNGFDILHLDVTAKPIDVIGMVSRQEALIEDCEKIAKGKVVYEVGIDAHSDKYTNLYDFLSFIEMAKHPSIKFVGGNTGLYVHGKQNTNNFNAFIAKRLVRMCAYKDLYYRQHNADYLGQWVYDGRRLNLESLRKTGIQSVNVAPEYGVEETTKLLKTLTDYGLTQERKELEKIFYKSKKWKKWAKAWDYNKQDLAVIAGHYMFEDERVKEILTKVQQVIPLSGILQTHLETILKKHLRECGWEIP